MRTVNGQVPGGAIADDLLVLGQITGDATVQPGARLVLQGQVAGSLTIEAGGAAEVHGQVAKNVINRGRLELSGQIVGRLHDESGDSTVAPGAEIFGHA